jgi:cytochrome c oxidase subunit 1
MVPSPVPEHNFDEIPTVTRLDEFWYRKYGTDESGRMVRIAETTDVTQRGDRTDVHLPSPSYWPLVISVGLPIIGYGLIFNMAWTIVGALVTVAGIYGWALEPADDDENPPHHHGHHDDAPDDGGAAAALEPGEAGAPEEADEAASAETAEEAPVG